MSPSIPKARPRVPSSLNAAFTPGGPETPGLSLRGIGKQVANIRVIDGIDRSPSIPKARPRVPSSLNAAFTPGGPETPGLSLRGIGKQFANIRVIDGID